MAVQTSGRDVQAALVVIMAALAGFLTALALERAAAEKSSTGTKPLFDADEVGRRVQERAQAAEAAEKAAIRR